MKASIFTVCLLLLLLSSVMPAQNTSNCPELKVVTINIMAKEGAVMGFVAEVTNFPNEKDVGYEWSVTNGLDIVRGQGTKYLEARRKTNDSGTATVNVTGLSAGCKSIESGSAGVIDFSNVTKIDEFGVAPLGRLKAAIDNFYIELGREPTARGIIVIQRHRGHASAGERPFTMSAFSEERPFPRHVCFYVGTGKH